jgi:molecular chaperone GrpE
MSDEKKPNETNQTDAKSGSKTAEEQKPAAESASGETDEMALAQLQSDLERFRDLALRSQADFDNYRKRAAREKKDAVKFANMSLLERLIPILDNFELGLAAARGSAKDSPILAGMEMVAKQLNDFLVDSGVQPIDATGQKFDPNLHEAIAHEQSDEVEEGKVIRQMRKGYKLKDRLLRAANVVVSKGRAEKTEE